MTIRDSITAALSSARAASAARSDAATSDVLHERERVMLASRLRRQGVPARLVDDLVGGRDEHGNAWRDTEATRELASAIDAGRRIVVLGGAAGTGKTIAATLWLRDQGYGAWTDTHRYTALAPWDTERHSIAAASALVLDEVGLELDGKVRDVEHLLCERYSNGRPIVCTTNLSLADWRRRYSERVIQRVLEVGAFRVVREIVRPGVKGGKR